jgi:hypothetical protein
MKPTIAVTVLRTVLVSDDGIKTRTIVQGTTDIVLADLFPGLEAEGYVSAVNAPKVGEVGKIEIPDDWQSQHHLAIIALGRKLDPAVTNRESAVSAIEAALATRNA